MGIDPPRPPSAAASTIEALRARAVDGGWAGSGQGDADDRRAASFADFDEFWTIALLGVSVTLVLASMRARPTWCGSRSGCAPAFRPVPTAG